MSFRNVLTTCQRLLATTRASALSSQLTKPSIRTMASIPNTMKGVIMESTGGTEVLQYKTDIPVPQPKEGQILVKNDFLGVNFIDTCVFTISDEERDWSSNIVVDTSAPASTHRPNSLTRSAAKPKVPSSAPAMANCTA